MAKIKKTKTVLKSQRDALARYERYLPVLELKKQQLRQEVNRLTARLDENRRRRDDLRAAVREWEGLFAEEVGLGGLLRIRKVRTTPNNVAGISVPIYEGVDFERKPVDLFATPPWTDDGLAALEQLLQLDAEFETLEHSRALLSEELRVTNQRVNLFEKVKIPECRENIRVIRISLADEQTAAVARAKMTKREIIELETSA